MTVLAPEDDASVAALLSDYAPPEGVADELLDERGRIRPVWQAMVDHLAGMDEAGISRAFSRGDQYLRDAGVFYRKYSVDSESIRDWPLSHMPVLIHEDEWTGIETALIERAHLLERVCADLYGPNRLVQEGILPGCLVAGNREWLRPMVGHQPASGHFLHFIAFDIERGPGGQWWVLSDRTQAPSGAGYALENRVATRYVFPELFASSNVERLSGFFRAFRDAMSGHCASSIENVGILTPGPMNDTYYEHAYIARYLGFMLLEGEDLIVEQGRLMVRTIEGLRPLEVLWRRLDAQWADPLELDENSRLGTPGMVKALRQGHLTMANELGTGILETRALQAFMPRISEVLTGQGLSMPNVATWWCGQKSERDYVLKYSHRMVIGDALSTNPPFEGSDTISIAGARRRDDKRSLAEVLEDEGEGLVAHEAVTLSTTPAFVDGKLQPRPVSLRIYLARTAGGWQVMPGGTARIGLSGDPSALSLQTGGNVADIWIVRDQPLAPEPFAGEPEVPLIRRDPGALPSRAADNLLWLGRYVERAEHTIRLIRALHARLAEGASPESDLARSLVDYLTTLGMNPDEPVPEGLLYTLSASLNSGGKVRDRLSVDGWMALESFNQTTHELAPFLKPGDDTAQAMGVLLRKLSSFSGLVHENMYRFSGWLFLSMGRAIERALETARLLGHFLDDESPNGSWDLILEVGDSTLSHRRVYPTEASRQSVIELLALDLKNPRSILSQLTEIEEIARQLPRAQVNGQMSPLLRSIVKTRTDLAIRTADVMYARDCRALEDQIGRLTQDVVRAYLE